MRCHEPLSQGCQWHRQQLRRHFPLIARDMPMYELDSWNSKGYYNELTKFVKCQASVTRELLSFSLDACNKTWKQRN